MFQNEAMTGALTNDPVFSRLTLAVMEDTGYMLPSLQFVTRSCLNILNVKSETC